MLEDDRRQTREAFMRAIGKQIGSKPEPTPEAKATANVPGWFDPTKGKAVPFAQGDEVIKSTATWASGFMRAGAAKAAELGKGGIVSYRVPHEQTDRMHVGRIVETDEDKATVEIQEHLPDEEGQWHPVPTRHWVGHRDVHQIHSRFPDLEGGDEPDDDADDSEKVSASIRQSFGRFYMAWNE